MAGTSLTKFHTKTDSLTFTRSRTLEVRHGR